MPLFREFHADDVLVQYPDGSTTKGIEEHVEWANGFWSAFDSEISEHPIKLAHGDWTAVIGEISITFARPLETPDGETISPTGKTWQGRMCTVARWEDGEIAEEILFWDNLDVMKTVGAL